jgi:RHS repeat-associated protein
MPQVNSFDRLTVRILCFFSILILSIFIFSPSEADAQASGTVTDANTTGIKPFATASGSDIENVDFNTGSLNVNIPITQVVGRGGVTLPIAINYSPRYWDWINIPHEEGGGQQLVLNDTYGWNLSTPTLRAQFIDFSCYPDTGTFDPFETGFIFTDSMGANHAFQNKTPTRCSSNNTKDYSEDMTGMVLSTPSFQEESGQPHTLYLSNGVKYVFKPWGGISSETYIPDTITDTNGNSIKSDLVQGSPSQPDVLTWTDTMGRKAAVISGWFTNGGGVSSIVVRDSNGSPQTYDFQWITVGAQCDAIFSFGCSGPPLPEITQINMLSQITLPNGRSYHFSYQNTNGTPNPGGELTRIDLPTGGYIRYEYRTLPNGENSAIVGCNIESRVVSKRVYSPNGVTENTWLYDYTRTLDPSCLGQKITTVTDPSGNKQVYTFSPLDSFHHLEFFETARDYTDSSGNLQKHVAQEWEHDNKQCYNTFQPGTCSNGGKVNYRVKSRTETFPNTNQITQATDQYDAITIVRHVDNGGTLTDTVTRGNVLQTQEHDYGIGAPGSLLRTTVNSYLGVNPANSIDYTADNLHIWDRKASETVYDGAGNTQAQTIYTYDSTPVQNDLGGAPNHDPNYSTSYYTRGNLTQVQHWLNPGNTYITTATNYYDDLGNLRQTTDGDNNSTYFDYSNNFDFTCLPAGSSPQAWVTQTTNALGQHTQTQYFGCTGLVASTRDQNDINANRNHAGYAYDAMNRVTQVTYADTGQVTNCYTDVGGATCSQTGPPYQVVTTQTINSSVPPKKTTALTDGLGRVVQTQVNSDPDGETHVDTAYDALGRVQSASNPYRPATESTHGITQHQYDALGREIKTIESDGSTVTTDYSEFPAVTVTDETGRQRRNQTDALGRLLTVWEPDDNGNLSYETDYYYNALDNLEHVVQKGNDPNSANWRQRDFAYDSLSRLTFSNNPESGAIYYGYDNNGNLTAKISPTPNQTDPSSQIQFLFGYDQLNRLVWRWNYSQPSDPVDRFWYDVSSEWGTPVNNSIGRLVLSQSDGGSNGSVGTIYSYDKMGREEFELEYNKRNDYTVHKQFNYSYNLDGSQYQVHYPTGRTITYHYNAAQRPDSAKDLDNNINFATAAHYFAFGGLGYVVHGSTSSFGGVVETENYNVRLQPNEIHVAVGTQPPLFDLVYDMYSCGRNNGNVCQVLNGKDSARSQAFAYDYLNRLIWAWTPNLNSSGAHNWGESFGYDPWGNLLQKNTMGSDNPPDTSLNVAVNGKNQVTSWCYDAAGNVVDPNQPCPPIPSGPNVYDGQNRLTANIIIMGPFFMGATNYDYDADGERIKKTSSSGDGTLYWRGPGGEVLEETDLNGALKNEYVFFGGKRIARYNPTNGYSYYFSDHLGSADVVTDALGQIKEESDFYPFGGERIVTNSGIDNRYKFTGKERDPETGCDFFGARYYCNPIGRFITPDWADKPTDVPYASFGNPQSLNLYSYVKNNPTTFTDPDGHCGPCIIIIPAAIVSIAIVYHLSHTPQGQAALHGFAHAAQQVAHDIANGIRSLPHPSTTVATGPPGSTTTNVQTGTPGSTATPVQTGTPGLTATTIPNTTTLTTVSAATKDKIETNAGGKCEYCGVTTTKPQKSQKGVSPSNTERQTDHYCPQCKGGTDDEENLANACRGCNRAKSDADPTNPEDQAGQNWKLPRMDKQPK